MCYDASMIDEALRRMVEVTMPRLDEKGRRLFLGSLAQYLGHGGIGELNELTGVSRTTISDGKAEAARTEGDAKARPAPTAIGRVRAEGAGRQPVEAQYPDIKEKLLLLLDGNTVGNPENPLCWTTKSLRNLADGLSAMGIPVSYVTVKALLEEMGFSLQQNKKYLEAGESGPDRDAQFAFINGKSCTFLCEGMPVISVDTKKKELVGNYKNGGGEYAPKGRPAKVLDHDFFDPALGKASPYGIYDVGANEGFVNVGLGPDTGAFAVNSIRSWWDSMGRERYPQATRLLVTADGGGSNGRRNRLFKTSLQSFANDSGLEIHVSHLPPGTSKWNKIEHKLFCYISKNWCGRPLETTEVIVSLIASTTTSGGLKVRCVVDPNNYERGIKVSDDELQSLNLHREAWHGQWNYIIMPQANLDLIV